MGRIQLNTTIIYRVPQFSYEAKFKDCWEALKVSIQETASSDFYRGIAHCTADEVARLPDAVRLTIWKYFNRARYRATPYGSFAGLGIIHHGPKPAIPAIISLKQEAKSFPDWECAEKISVSFMELVSCDSWLLANHTYYTVGDDIRFVCRGEDGYELADLPLDRDLLSILTFCQNPQRISQILGALNEACQKRSCLEVIKQMLEDQLLISSKHPNIIGEDYFRRVGASFNEGDVKYIISERPLQSGHIAGDIFKNVPPLVEKLHQLLPSYNSPELEKFASLFIEKFGEAEVPLMVALDPELGVGYGAMEQDMLSSELVEKLTATRSKSKTPGATLDLLLPILARNLSSVIQLEDIGLPANLHNSPLPNSIPLLLTYGAGMLQLEHAGGATANSLLGRFTLANDTILNHCRNMAALEQNANPEVLFFDIGYVTGKRIDNVNRRKAIYDLQLSILNYDTSASPLALNDLYVSVSGSQVILRSKKLNKRLIPRLATAYNYLLSDLPVFRFLCDLQHQGTHKNLSLRLRDRLPEMDYYPRIQYGNIVLSPATWLIRWGRITNAVEQTASEALANHLLQKAIPRYVKFGNSDQTLCIDTQNGEDCAVLLATLKKQKLVYLEETFFNTVSVLQDENGAPYAPQFMVTLSHQDEIYKDVQTGYGYPATVNETPVILPARDWLYFEIFSHAARADQLLTNEIKSLVRHNSRQIKNWFFIRYTKNGAHIRLRLQLFNPTEGHVLSAAFMDLLQDKVNTGIISDISIKPYRRETGRYGQNHIETVEQHFQSDSAYVISLLRQQTTDNQKYQLCLALIDAVERASTIDPSQFHQLLKLNSNSYNAEHSLGAKEFKLLNQQCNHTNSGAPLFLPDDVITLLQQFTRSLIYLLQLYAEGERPGIFTSVFHMHVNRLFPTKQRVHETAIYYFAQKVMNKKAALAKAVS